jgi:DNA-binding NarL/FixJ family response regulator
MKNCEKNSEGKARVLLVDDHPLVRDGLLEMINRTSDLVGCGEAGNTADAQKAVAELKPDLVLLDLRLHNSDGLELVKIFKAQFPSLKVLILSQLDEMTYAERALRAGAMGYVMKENATKEVLSAMRTVLAGEIFVSQKIKDLAVRRMANGKKGADNKSASPVEKLTDRELQIFQLLGRGVGTKKIADDLCLSHKTIQTHRENIKQKLGLRDAAGLVHHATLWMRNEGQSKPENAIS